MYSTKISFVLKKFRPPKKDEEKTKSSISFKRNFFIQSNLLTNYKKAENPFLKMSTPDQTSKSGKGPKIDLSSLSSQIKKDARAQCFPPTSPIGFYKNTATLVVLNWFVHF